MGCHIQDITQTQLGKTLERMFKSETDVNRPTYTTFTYLFSEMHNRHQPGWQYYRAFMDYVARSQQIAQSGVPKVDIAFWQKKTAYNQVPQSYQPSDLELAGYTYEYLSPDDFSLPGVYVEDRVLAPQQQAFKAMVVRGNDTLTAFGVRKLAEWAHNGLPVFFSGGIPSNVSGTISAENLRTINATLERLTKLSNVHVVPYDGLAQSLSSAGVQPKVSLSGSQDVWYTRWFESAEESTVLIYWDALAPSPLSNKTVTFTSTGAPYIYDAWTGAQAPVKVYSQAGKTTTMTLTLAGNQTTILAFRKHERQQASKKQSTTTVGSLDLSRNWKLTLESWTPPADIFDIEGTVKKNSTYQIDRLLPWNQLSVRTNLTFVSGRGFYHSSFAWPSKNARSKSADEAVLSMSPIIHTAMLYINGHEMRPLDVTAPEVDIVKYLRKGENTIDVVVSSPLGNAMIPVLDNLRTMGASAELSAGQGAAFGGTSLIQPREYGLVGDVTLKLYKKA